jgi:hypothetical protein
MSWITRRARANAALINRDGQSCTYTPEGGAAVSLNACILKDTDALGFDAAPREERYLAFVDSADVEDRPQKGDTLRTAAGAAYVLDNEAEDADGLWRLTMLVDTNEPSA